MIVFLFLLLFGWGSFSTYADVNNLVSFGLGFATGSACHEIGHASLILAQGGYVTDIGLMYTNGNFSDKDTHVLDYKKSVVSLGGYIAESLATEVILQTESLHKNDFALGWMYMGIYCNISNPFFYYVLGSKKNDLGYYASTGADPLIPSLLMVGYGIYALQRAISSNDISDRMSRNIFNLKFDF